MRYTSDDIANGLMLNEVSQSLGLAARDRALETALDEALGKAKMATTHEECDEWLNEALRIRATQIELYA